jgi:hypothetical protein
MAHTYSTIPCPECGDLDGCHLDGICRAPWNAEQVKALNTYQVNSRFHPYTCDGCDNRDGLIATIHGWICPWCDYRQDWCHHLSLHVPKPLQADDGPPREAKDLVSVIRVYDATLYCLILAGLRPDLPELFKSQIACAHEAHREVLGEEPMSSPASIAARMAHLEATCPKST